MKTSFSLAHSFAFSCLSFSWILKCCLNILLYYAIGYCSILFQLNGFLTPLQNVGLMLLKLQIVFILTVKYKQGLNTRSCERINFIKFEGFLRLFRDWRSYWILARFRLELLPQVKYSRTKSKSFRRTFLDQIKHLIWFTRS